MCKGALSPNHDFIAGLALREAGSTGFRALDYGCGTGFFVGFARARGLDFHGCDTFDGIWSDWINAVDAATRPFIHPIEAGKLPFPDAHFDIITSNQVFEHIPDHLLEPVLAEIARVLKPGGTFIALFPTRDVWFEGHLGVYFVHWMRGQVKSSQVGTGWREDFTTNKRGAGSKLRDAWLSLNHRLGLGYYRDGKPRETWVREMSDILDGSVFYHTKSTIDARWREAFGSVPRGEEAAFITHRLALIGRLRIFAKAPLNTLFAPVYRFICRIRAGRVLLVRKRASFQTGMISLD